MSVELFHIPHGFAHIVWLLHARPQGHAMDFETVLVRQSEFSQPRLGDWDSILQAAIGFRHIVHTSHAKIIYTNIRQSSKQQ